MQKLCGHADNSQFETYFNGPWQPGQAVRHVLHGPRTRIGHLEIIKVNWIEWLKNDIYYSCNALQSKFFVVDFQHS